MVARVLRGHASQVNRVVTKNIGYRKRNSFATFFFCILSVPNIFWKNALPSLQSTFWGLHHFFYLSSLLRVSRSPFPRFPVGISPYHHFCPAGGSVWKFIRRPCRRPGELSHRGKTGTSIVLCGVNKQAKTQHLTKKIFFCFLSNCAQF